MFSLRNRFGIPGVISVIALVFAMLGGAYAASSSSSGGKATASAKAKRGPRGPKGATGPAGPAGAAGTNGKDGVAGSNGKDGVAGTNGSPGKSVVLTNTASNCNEGGISAEVEGTPASKKEVCNGEEGLQGIQGPPGPEGVCSTSSCHLPTNVTETGTWTVDTTEAASFSLFHDALVAFSFNIPLAAALDASHVHFIGQNETPGGSCTGNIGNPTAASGHLCIYGEVLDNEFNEPPLARIHIGAANGNPGAGVSGGFITFDFAGTSTELYGNGSWAVTG